MNCQKNSNWLLNGTKMWSCIGLAPQLMWVNKIYFQLCSCISCVFIGCNWLPRDAL